MLSIYRIQDKLPDEKVIVIIHRHVLVLIKRALFFIFLILLMIGFGLLINNILPNLIFSDFFPPIFLLISGLTLCIWLFFFFSFIEFYLDAWIITSERIISIEQDGFFSRTISEQRLFRIQDVTTEVKGILPTLFSYGNVFIQTAGEKERFDFEQVPHPDKIRDQIIKLAEIDRQKQSKEVLSEDNAKA